MTDDRLRSVFDALATTAMVVMVISIFRWTVLLLPVPSLGPRGGALGTDSIYRVIRSNEALVVGQALILTLFSAEISRGVARLRLLSPLLLAAVVTLQHRSVWVATMAGILAHLLVGQAKKGVVKLFTVAAIGGLVIIPLTMSTESELGQDIAKAAERAATLQDSAGERLSSWQELVATWYESGPIAIVIGKPFGTQPTRYVWYEDQHQLVRIEHDAHNFFVSTLLSTGLIGMGGLLYVLAYTLVGLVKRCREDRNNEQSKALLAVFVMQVSYCVPYMADYLQGLLLGVALAFVAGGRRIEAPILVKRIAVT